MLNKLVFSLVLLLFSFLASAQVITLEKNNSLEKVRIKIPKKVKLTY